jgi:ADP-ribose pyrophosphatase YjhB (NUDIX family)
MTETKLHAIRIRVAGLVIQDGKLLLIEHQKDGRGYWLVPGGGVEFGEACEAAVIREMKEELNIDVKVKDLAFASDSIGREDNRHILNLFFSCDYTGGEYRLADEERLLKFDFFTAAEIRKLKMFPPCNETAALYLEGKKFPVYLGELWER